MVWLVVFGKDILFTGLEIFPNSDLQGAGIFCRMRIRSSRVPDPGPYTRIDVCIGREPSRKENKGVIS
jgi:hypothetical protein